MMQAFNQAMAEGFYRLFWRECGTKGLTVEDKINNLCKLRDLSLKLPYWLLKEDETIKIRTIGKQFCQVPQIKCEECRAFKKGRCRQKLTLSDMFPQLIPANLCKEQGHTHLSQLSGLLLYTMHTEIFKEIKAMAENGKLTEEQIKQIGDF